MHKFILTILTLGTLFWLTACGGSNAATPATVAPTSRAMTTNILRIYLSGDFIQYSETEVVTGGANYTMSGTTTESFIINASPPDPTGVVRSVSTSSTTGTLSTGAPYNAFSTGYYSQDATGTINSYGDSAILWIVVPASGFIPLVKSPIVAPSSWSITSTYQSGATMTGTKTLLGRATVTTGMGTFETYKYQTNGTFVDGAISGTTTIFSYIVPSIGMVKSTSVSTYTDAAGVPITSNRTMIASTTNIAF